MTLLNYEFLDLTNSRHIKMMDRLLSFMGKKFNSMTIVGYNTPKYDKENCIEHWAECICDCGKRKSVRLGCLLNNTTKTCGCARFAKGDIIGQKFGRLTIMEDIPNRISKSKSKGRYVKCLCYCGNITTARYSGLKNKTILSCGCLQRESARNQATHRLVDHKLYKVWSSMKDRCGNPNNSGYKNYGGKGVIVCQEWLADFKVFYDWCIENGWKPGLVIDKDIKYKAKHETDTGMIYSPEYCTVVSYKENLRSTRRSRNITIKGETKTMIEWSEISGIDAKTIWSRIKRGWESDNLLSPCGEINANFRKILQYDLDGKLIAEHISAAICERNNPELKRTGIKQCLRGLCKTYKKSIWKYAM